MLVAPLLLPLFAEGFADDPWAADGHHLHWLIDPDLGLPRDGFRLYRREGIDRAPPSDLEFHVQTFSPGDGVVDPAAPWRWTTPKLAVTRPDRQAIQHVSEPVEGIRLGGTPLVIDLSPPYQACYVEVSLVLTAPNGRAIVEAFRHRGGHGDEVKIGEAAGAYGRLGRRAVGFWADARRLPGSARADLSSAALRRYENRIPLLEHLPEAFTRDNLLQPVAASRLEESAPDPVAEPGAPAPWVVRRPVLSEALASSPRPQHRAVTLRIGAGTLHRLRIVGRRAVIAGVRWVTPEQYARSKGWALIAETHIPTPEAGGTRDEGVDRMTAPTRNRAADPLEPGRASPPPQGAGQVETDELEDRYLAQWDAQLRYLTEEMLKRAPAEGLQRDVQVEVTFAGGAGNSVEASSRTARVSPLGLLLAASLDASFARFFGTYHVDTPPEPGKSYDYLLAARARFAELPPDHVRLLQPHADGDGSYVAVTSLAIGVRMARRPLPAAPALEVRADGIAAPPPPPAPLPPVIDLPAQPELSWPLSDPLGPASEVIVDYAARREQGGADSSLGALAGGYHQPIAPDRRDARAVLVDRGVAAGDAIYRVAGRDLFGRWSPFAERSFNAASSLRPPPPTRLAAKVAHDPDPWTPPAPVADLEVSFDWPDELDAQFPDVTRFHLHARGGPAQGADAASLASWGRFERTTGASDPPLLIPFRDARGLAPHSAPPSGVAGVGIAIQRYDEDVSGVHRAGWRVRVTVTGVSAPAIDAGRGRVTVAVTALRLADLESDPVGGPYAVITVDTTPPLQPALPLLERATFADATGASSYTLALPEEFLARGDRFVVWRAADHGVLEGMSAEERAAYDALPIDGKAQLLRQRAVARRDAFARQNDDPIPIPGGAALAAHTDTLPGRAQNLWVYGVVGVSRTGVEGAWPGEAGFVVVQVPSREVPAPPVPDGARALPEGVELRFRFDARIRPEAIEIFRCLRSDRAADVHDMKQLRVVELPEALEDGALSVLDDDGLAPFRRYFYRAVALGPPPAPGLPRTRSRQSELLSALTFTDAPPPEATEISISAAAAPFAKRVRFRAALPALRTEAGPYRFALWRSLDGGATWEQRGVAEAGAPTAADAPLRYAVEGAPDGTRWFLFEDRLDSDPGPALRYRVRTLDPAGRWTDAEIAPAP